MKIKSFLLRPTVIHGGDFNADPNSGVYELITTGKVS